MSKYSYKPSKTVKRDKLTKNYIWSHSSLFEKKADVTTRNKSDKVDLKC